MPVLMPMIVLVWSRTRRAGAGRYIFVRLVMCCCVRWDVFLTTDDDVRLGSGNAAAHHARDFESGPDVQGCDRLFKEARGHSGIQKRAQKHVAADTAETIEVSYFHVYEPFTADRANDAERPYQRLCTLIGGGLNSSS
jgi:hypothetical protein